MFPDVVHTFLVQRHVFPVQKHMFSAQKHKTPFEMNIFSHYSFK